MESKAVVIALTALAHETRLGVFRMLVQAGPDGLAVGTICESVGVPPTSLSFHLKELSTAGLVSVRRSGRYLMYAAEFTAMNNLVAYLTENCCGGVPCLPACGPVAIELPMAEKSTTAAKQPSKPATKNSVRKS